MAMLLADVLDIHNSFNQVGNRAILGDGYLLESNPIYKKIREFSLEIGCSYVEAYPRYLLLPFHELPKIVETKKVPFVPHAQLMADVERSRPDTFSTLDVPMPESYHLHESAHVIAEHVFKDVAVKGPHEKILKAILCESFANTVDALVCMPAGDEIHRFFIQQNCYMRPDRKVMQAMARISSELGNTFLFMLTFFTYVQANFLARPLGKKQIQELAAKHSPGLKLSPRILKDCQTVCAVGEKLDPNFRVTTTGNYLKQEGFSGDLVDLLDFNYRDVLSKNKGFLRAIESLSRVLS